MSKSKKKKANFNETHPEMGRDEAFLTNIRPDPVYGCRFSLELIGKRKARMGKVAYNSSGKPIDGMKPVFVKRTNFITAGADPDSD